MERTGRRTTGIHLTTLVAIAVTGAFATALIVITRDVTTLWPLYVVPIVIAALSYHLAGAVLVSALVSGLLALLLYGMEADVSALPELIVGMGAFAISAVVIGVQAQRSLRHREALEEASVFDSLTGQFKREYLIDRLAEEVRRAERYHLRTSFLLVRVNCFDEFKEQFGRYKADLLLEHLGEVLQVNSRDTDVLGRYDAISFALVLPHADATDATMVAKHLRQAVERTEFEGDVLEPATHCTISTGGATYPDDGSDTRTLVGAAAERIGEVEP